MWVGFYDSIVEDGWSIVGGAAAGGVGVFAGAIAGGQQAHDQQRKDESVQENTHRKQK